jgi:Replication protein C C-terminal region
MAYLCRPSPTWPELVDAADWLRHDLDVSKPLWGEACLAMGREQAAIALPWSRPRIRRISGAEAAAGLGNPVLARPRTSATRPRDVRSRNRQQAAWM